MTPIICLQIVCAFFIKRLIVELRAFQLPDHVRTKFESSTLVKRQTINENLVFVLERIKFSSHAK